MKHRLLFYAGTNYVYNGSGIPRFLLSGYEKLRERYLFLVVLEKSFDFQ